MILKVLNDYVSFFFQMGTAPEKTFYVGQSLNDDIYHTLVFKRRGIKIRAVVDDDTPVLGTAAA